MKRPAWLALVSLSACVFLVPAVAAEINVAPIGTATQSSTGWGGTPDRGNDGNTDGIYVLNYLFLGGPAPRASPAGRIPRAPPMSAATRTRAADPSSPSVRV